MSFCVSRKKESHIGLGGRLNKNCKLLFKT